MEKNYYSEEDKKMLESIKHDSVKKNELVLTILFFKLIYKITSLNSTFILTLLIFSLSWGLVTLNYEYSLFLIFIYMFCHFIFFEFYIKLIYKKTIEPFHYVSYEAIEILKYRLKEKKYD